MENITEIVHKVRQAPWRVQRQWIGLVLLAVVVIAMIAGVYINVTVRASISGRQVIIFTGLTEENERINADYETSLAAQNSSESMQARAEDLGFHPANVGDITYIVVPGYVESHPINLSTQGSALPPSLVKAAYTETIFDWLTRKMTDAGAQP